MLAGGLSGFAGLVLTGRLSAAMPSSATGLEMDVIAAVVIGGASLFGGKGNMIGTFFGVLTIGVLRNGLNLLNVSPFWVQFVQGAVIFVAVLLDAVGQKRDDNLLTNNLPRSIFNDQSGKSKILDLGIRLTVCCAYHNILPGS
jgi:ribose/xylose/arabinose/galactoside ABC-type transport system permease subunit